MNKENNENQFEKLISDLEAIKKPSITDAKKLKLKNRVFTKLSEQESSYYSLTTAISKVLSIFKIDSTVKTRIKENVFAIIEHRAQKKVSIFTFLNLSKRYVSLALVIVMFSGFFSFLSLDTSIARADSFSTIESLKGLVAVQRDGEFLVVYNGFKVKEDDKVFTSGNGEVVVKYFDDTVNRLSNNTIIEINKLDDQGSSYVEISLLDGVVWSKVMNLNDVDSIFVMEFDGLQVQADGSAAFNIELEDGQAEVEVFTSAVEIESSFETEKVVKGEKLVLDVENSELGTKKKIRNVEKNDSWVEENLNIDESYLIKIQEDLLVKQIDLVGVEVNDELNFDNSLREDTLLYFTFDDVKKHKIELEIAEKNFIEAQIKLNDENLSLEEKERIQFVIKNFKKEVKEFYMLVEEIDYKDSVYASELKFYIDGKIIDYKKDLSLFTPENPQYESKEIVTDLEVLTADTQEEVVEIKIEQAEQKMDLIEEIVEEDFEVVTEIVNEYTDEITNVIEMVDYIDEDAEVTENMVEGFKADLDLLESIEDEADVNLESGEVKAEIVEAVDDVGLDSALIEEQVYVPIVVEAPIIEVIQSEIILEIPYAVKFEGDKVLPPLFK